jgi:hypothetical protein
MAIIVAACAVGLAVFWGVLGVKGLIGERFHEVDPEGIVRRLQQTGGNGALLGPLSIVNPVLDLLTTLLLVGGAVLIVLRKVPGAFLVAGAVVVGILAAAGRYVYYSVVLGWSAPSEPYIAAVLTLIVGVLAILPPVTNALKPTAQPQFGHPQSGQFPPQQQFPQQQFPPQGPPPGYGPPQGPPPPGYGPPR